MFSLLGVSDYNPISDDEATVIAWGVLIIIGIFVFGFFHLLHTATRPLTDAEKARGEELIRNVRDKLLCPEGHGTERPTCDGATDCAEPVTHIDQDGYAYCTAHGLERRRYQPCRKLRDWELRKLQRGETLAKY